MAKKTKRIRLVGGPCAGELVPYSAQKQTIGLPLDRHLNTLKGPGEVYAHAFYKLDKSGRKPVYRFHSAQRTEAEEPFEVEFIDGPMKGTHPFPEAIQLRDRVIPVPLGPDYRVLEEGANVGAIAEYRRKKIDGVWKMAFVRLVESEDKIEQYSDLIAERKFMQELSAYTAEQLIQELLSRPDFPGMILVPPGKLAGDWRPEIKGRFFIGIGRGLDADAAKALVRHALNSLEGQAGR